MSVVRRALLGSAVGVLLSLAFGTALIPVRSHLNVAIAGLVLVVPVVAGVTVGGYIAGLAGVAAGFLVYDFVFIPPYYTLNVGAGDNWLALVVYTVVMVLVARVVANLHVASEASAARAANAQRLVEVSELLLGDRSLGQVVRTVVDAVHEVFQVGGVALLLTTEERLEVVAAAGEGIGDPELARLRPGSRQPVPLTTDVSGDRVQALAMTASGRPVGLLALTGMPADPALRETLPALANHVALAIERAQMRDQVRRAELLEEIDRLRHALVGAVSHDLRTPLATIKVASSTLVNPESDLTASDTAELHHLIDEQTDRLTRIVNDVLDMTRIQAGVLEPRPSPCSVPDLLAAAVTAVRPARPEQPIDVEVCPELPEVEVDHLLIEQALYNLLDNASRHAPPGTAIAVRAEPYGRDQVAISVADHGQGVPRAERQSIFDTFVRFDTGGRAGLGLAISKSFVEAHGQRIWVEEAEGGGARFVITLPVAAGNGSLG